MQKEIATNLPVTNYSTNTYENNIHISVQGDRGSRSFSSNKQQESSLSQRTGGRKKSRPSLLQVHVVYYIT